MCSCAGAAPDRAQWKTTRRTRCCSATLDEVGEPYILEVLADGESALEFVRAHCRTRSPQPCLIILDLHLSRHDGAAILRAIRSEPEVAVAVLADSPSPAERAEVLRLGVQAFRAKPMDLDETFALARDLLHLCQVQTFASAGRER